MDADGELARLASTQHGIITNAEARAIGLTQRQLDGRVQNGRLVRVHRGVYAIAGAPATWEQRAMAAVLAAGDGALASHSTAAALLGLTNSPHHKVEVMVPRRRLPRMDGVAMHRSVALEDTDRRFVGAIPVTSAARTIVDLTGGRGLGWIARAMDDAMRRNLALLPDLDECANRLRGAPGRRPSVVRFLVDERRIGGGKTESWPERLVLRLLLEAGVPEPVPQYWVTVAGHRYRLDLAWPEQKVALEVDVFGTHSSYGSFHDDRRRDLLLSRAGWLVLRVTDETPTDEIVDAVLEALARASDQPIL